MVLKGHSQVKFGFTEVRFPVVKKEIKRLKFGEHPQCLFLSNSCWLWVQEGKTQKPRPAGRQAAHQSSDTCDVPPRLGLHTEGSVFPHAWGSGSTSRESPRYPMLCLILRGSQLSQRNTVIAVPAVFCPCSPCSLVRSLSKSIFLDALH